MYYLLFAATVCVMLLLLMRGREYCMWAEVGKAGYNGLGRVRGEGRK